MENQCLVGMAFVIKVSRKKNVRGKINKVITDASFVSIVILKVVIY